MEKIGDEVDYEENLPVRLSYGRKAEIVSMAFSVFFEHEIYGAGFDVFSMLKKMHVTVLKISRFSDGNLQRFKEVSLCFRSSGFYCRLVKADAEEIKLVAYDDTLCKDSQTQTLLHELGHILLEHTEQCQIGELEAELFSDILFMLMNYEASQHCFESLVSWMGKESCMAFIKKMVLSGEDDKQSA